jgi:hypothetical protein
MPLNLKAGSTTNRLPSKILVRTSHNLMVKRF